MLRDQAIEMGMYGESVEVEEQWEERNPVRARADRKWGGAAQEPMWYYREVWLDRTKERDPNFNEDPKEGPEDMNQKYYLGARFPEWDDTFDESAIEEGMGGVYNECEAEMEGLVFDDPVDGEKGDRVGDELDWDQVGAMGGG